MGMDAYASKRCWGDFAISQGALGSVDCGAKRIEKLMDETSRNRALLLPSTSHDRDAHLLMCNTAYMKR